jgi:hypothetical protein
MEIVQLKSQKQQILEDFSTCKIALAKELNAAVFKLNGILSGVVPQEGIGYGVS